MAADWQWGTWAQADPSAAALTDLWTVPEEQQIVACVVATNRNDSLTFVRIAVVPGGGSASGKHYLGGYDLPVTSNNVFRGPVFAAQAGTVVKVYALAGNVSFAITGARRKV